VVYNVYCKIGAIFFSTHIFLLKNCFTRAVALRGAQKIAPIFPYYNIDILFSVVYTSDMILVVGLGNPGEEYEKTRHNAGRIVLEHIAKANDFTDWKDDMKLKSFRSKGEINGEKTEFLLPNTFMNNSGNAVVPLIDTPKKLSKLIVVYDDLDIPVGSLKISFNRSSGGHNGLGSIIKKVKSEEFVRIRIGVSPHTPTGKIKKPKGEDAVLKFLLGKFKDDELKVLKKQSKEVAEIIAMISSDGYQKAMSIYN
jgi:PTH1 family peptidyl-tRNA hydrolase